MSGAQEAPREALASLTPCEIDTRLAEISGRAYVAEMRLASLTARDWRGNARGSEQEQETARETLRAILEEARPYNDEFTRRPWSRVFVVAGGHAHSTMECHTCYPTTRFSWLPEWSGKDETEIVSAAGDRACTVCYPSAPVDRPTRLYTAQERADNERAQAEREARAQRARERDAKAISYRGGPLRCPSYYGVIKTERAAEMHAVSCLVDLAYYRTDHSTAPDWRADFARIVEALSDKRAQAPDEIRAQLAVKAQKKYRRDFGQTLDLAHFTL
jgi:hypothetical protein